MHNKRKMEEQKKAKEKNFNSLVISAGHLSLCCYAAMQVLSLLFKFLFNEQCLANVPLKTY